VKFRVERDPFAEAVAWAARSLPPRPPVPVLAGLLLEIDADSDRLSLSSFDYEVSANASVEVSAAEPGRVLVSGRLLAEIGRSLPAHPIDVTVEGSRVVLACGSARFTLPTLPVDDYPSLPDMPTTAGTVGADVFAAAVAQVAIAAGRDDTLPVLTGVRVEIEGDRVTLAATDRYRLAVRELRWQPDTPGLSAVALIPARTLADTAKALTGGAEVTVSLSTGTAGQGLIGFTGRSTSGTSGTAAGERRTTTRLLDGEYVKYRSLLPEDSTANAFVETAPFVEAVKRVSLVAPRNTPVRLTFTGDQVVLEAGTGEDAQASESVDAKFDRRDGDSTEEFSIAFNPAYLLDGLTAVGAEITKFDFTAPTKPAVLRGGKQSDTDSDTGDDYRYLLMPVRLSG
jgi:DNA polymerase III subunit beta